MKQFLGKDGLLQELDKHMEEVIQVYIKLFQVDEKATNYYDLNPDRDGAVYVRFERSYCGCCPGDTVDSFTVTQAMLENPTLEIGKLLDERKRKRAKKEEEKKEQEKRSRRESKKRRKKEFLKLKKEFE